MTGENSNLEFIKDQLSRAVNHVIRHSDGTKGTVMIEVNSDGSYNVRIHKGSEAEPSTIEGISKDELMEMMDKNL